MSTNSKVKQPYNEAALYEYAVGALARRMRTVAELKRLMRRKIAEDNQGAELIERVVARLKEQKYLNDSQYAVTYARFRQENEKFGRRRVQQDLMVKGVHPEVIEKTLTAAYLEINEEELARKFIARKRLKKPSGGQDDKGRNEKEVARIFRMLARAGFSHAVIYAVLKKWEVDDETLMALGGE